MSGSQVEISELGKLLVDLRNGLQSCVEAIDVFLNYLGQRVADRESLYDKLPWEQREGVKGSFQMVSSRSCNNSNLFRHLQAILKQNGRYTESGWTHYYWLSQDEDIIFRRKKKRFQEAFKPP